MGQYSETMTWKAYLKIIFPLANILCERREHERKDTAVAATKTSMLLNKLTYSSIWWQPTDTEFPTLHYTKSSVCDSTQPCPHDTDKHNLPAFHQSHFQYISHWEARMARVMDYLAALWNRFYLSIVLEHLIALHVVTLEHDNRSVEAGDVQTEVICPNFFIRCVWEHLETRCLTQPMKNIRKGQHYLSFCI